MMTWLQRVKAWPKEVVVLACILSVIAVGLIDYATGYETFFFTFYLLAIFWGTWQVGGLLGSLLAGLSVTAWVSSNIEAGAHYSSYFVPVWNAGIMLTIYLIIVGLLVRLKKAHSELENRVRLRTDALTREIQERVRLQKELIETGDREQRRVGRELHDGLCQHLTGTALAGHLLAQKLGAASAQDSAQAARLVQLIEEAIEMTRNLSHQLDPVELKSGKIQDHLEDLAVGTRQRFKIDCQVNCRLDRPLDGPVATHLYRIAQEAVAQAVSHPEVKRIAVGLETAGNDIVLTVTDDGNVPAAEAIMDTEAKRSMSFRADLIGAILSSERLADRGTRLTCVLPAAGQNHAV
jgi:signal transduction histidine kinase